MYLFLSSYRDYDESIVRDPDYVPDDDSDEDPDYDVKGKYSTSAILDYNCNTVYWFYSNFNAI